MSPGKLLLLLAVTIATAGAAVWAHYDKGRPDTVLYQPGQVLFGNLTAPGARLDAVEITAPGYRLRIASAGGAWVLTDHAGYPIDAARVTRLIGEVAALTVWEPKTRRPEWFDRIWLEDPGGADARSHRLRFLGPDGAPLEDIVIGKPSDTLATRPSGGTFLRRHDESQAWLAQGRVTIPVTLGDWFGVLLQVPGPSVRHVAIRQGGDLVFEAEKPAGAATYSLVSADPALAPPGAGADDGAVKALVQGLLSIQPRDVRPEDGIAFPAETRSLDFTTESGLVLRVRLGRADGETWVTFRAEAPSGAEAQAAAINEKAAGRAFLIDPARLSALETPLQALFSAEG